jgi:hypothetical protein
LYRGQGKIKPCSPKVTGKHVLVFCTYSGPRTENDEASPAGKTMRHYFEHFGFNVVDELYIIGEFHDREDISTLGKLDDIRGNRHWSSWRKLKRMLSK